VCKSELSGYVLKLLISTAGGRFHFITVQGRHLFKETTFTVSTLPRAWLKPPRSLRSLWGLKAHAHSATLQSQIHLLFPQMFSVGRVIANVSDGTSSAQSQSQRPR